MLRCLVEHRADLDQQHHDGNLARSLKHQRDAGYGRWLLIRPCWALGFWRHSFRLATTRAPGRISGQQPIQLVLLFVQAAHGLHLCGGILALSYLLLRTTRKRRTVEGELRRAGAADAATIYWHFMDGLWVALFFLLFFWK